MKLPIKKTDAIPYIDTMEEIDENEIYEKTITKKKWVGPKAGHSCKEYADHQESEGQTGHKQTGCKSTSINGGTAGKGKFKGRCNHCNKPGHQEDTCWSKPGNEHKQTNEYGGRAVMKKRKRNGKVKSRNDHRKHAKVFYGTNASNA